MYLCSTYLWKTPHTGLSFPGLALHTTAQRLLTVQPGTAPHCDLQDSLTRSGEMHKVWNLEKIFLNPE